MNKFSKIVLASLAIFGAQACTDLEENLVGEITNDVSVPVSDLVDPGNGDFFDAGSQPLGELAGAFAELRNTGSANHGSYYSIQEIPTDEMVIAAKGGDWFDGGILIQLHQHTYTPSHGFIENAWNGSFTAINTINELLAGGTLSANATAQATTLRAFFYWRLMDSFGRVKILTAPGQDPPQVSRQEVFNFVESELLSVLDVSEITAGMDLSGSDLNTDNNPYQINLYGALGILAKVYLNAEVYTGTARWQEAADAASYIIDSGVYALCADGCAVPNKGKRVGVDSDPEMLEGYPAVFAPNNGGNPEHIFTIDYDEVNGTGMNFSQMNLHYSSQVTWNLQSQPWNGYATLEEFYNSYDDRDTRKTANFAAGNQQDAKGADILDFATDDDDGIVLNYTPAINELQPNSIRQAGARAAKFSFRQFGRDNMSNDYPIVRLGDVILMRGEALARQAGDWNASLPDVNMIRARANVADLGSIDAEEFLAERGREMFQESSRRIDLIRFGAYNGTWWEKPASDPSKNIFPIPVNQITVSDGTLTQNPGY